MTLSKASKKKPKRCKAVKNEPLGHFLNILPFSSVMKIETERNLKTFQIGNLAVKTALKQVNLHVKRAETSADADDIHFQAILVTIIVANQFFSLLNILRKYLWVFLVIGAPVSAAPLKDSTLFVYYYFRLLQWLKFLDLLDSICFWEKMCGF